MLSKAMLPRMRFSLIGGLALPQMVFAQTIRLDLHFFSTLRVLLAIYVLVVGALVLAPRVGRWTAGVFAGSCGMLCAWLMELFGVSSSLSPFVFSLVLGAGIAFWIGKQRETET